MSRVPGFSNGIVLPSGVGADLAEGSRTTPTKTKTYLDFDLLRWFSVVSFVAVFIFCISFAVMLSHFLRREILQRDAIQTSQFIVSIAESQVLQAQVGDKVSLAEVLDETANFSKLGIDPQVAGSIRTQFYDHLKVLPEVLLATVFTRDRRIIWSTNNALIGMVDKGNDELEEAYASHVMVSTEHDAGDEHQKREQQFVTGPEKFFVENYIPLHGRNHEVLAVVEIYKEPLSLQETIGRGTMLVWACAGLGTVFLYLSLFWIIRRADAMLAEQKRRLVESEALCVIGEMSAAVAHGIRNPLASIRSSAELALDGDPDSTRKNANDIIAQVDRLGKWVRDLLVFSRPVSGESQAVQLPSLIDDCLPNFEAQFVKGGISCEFLRPTTNLPAVLGNRSLLTQALGSVISNAVEAMQEGGMLRLELRHERLCRRIELIVSDSGSGMSESQLELAFKPFYTTKRKGIGLGMALVKRIMERFDGSVALHSREGEGTKVILSFSVA